MIQKLFCHKKTSLLYTANWHKLYFLDDAGYLILDAGLKQLSSIQHPVSSIEYRSMLRLRPFVV
jgi:hypothetical protein